MPSSQKNTWYVIHFLFSCLNSHSVHFYIYISSISIFLSFIYIYFFFSLSAKYSNIHQIFNIEGSNLKKQNKTKKQKKCDPTAARKPNVKSTCKILLPFYCFQWIVSHAERQKKFLHTDISMYGATPLLLTHIIRSLENLLFFYARHFGMENSC